MLRLGSLRRSARSGPGVHGDGASSARQVRQGACPERESRRGRVRVPGSRSRARWPLARQQPTGCAATGPAPCVRGTWVTQPGGPAARHRARAACPLPRARLAPVAHAPPQGAALSAQVRTASSQVLSARPWAQSVCRRAQSVCRRAESVCWWAQSVCWRAQSVCWRAQSVCRRVPAGARRPRRRPGWRRRGRRTPAGRHRGSGARPPVACVLWGRPRAGWRDPPGRTR